MADIKPTMNKEMIIQSLETYHDALFTPGVYEHSIYGQAALLLKRDTVEVVQFNALKSLINGEWVDCKLVEEALGIDFATGLKLFDFSRTAEWNPAPLNGQKITTKFRLKNAVVHGRWIETLVPDGYVQKASRMRKQCSECGWTNACRYNFCPSCGAKMDRERKDNA